MDLNVVRRRANWSSPAFQRTTKGSLLPIVKSGFKSMNLIKTLAVCFIALALFVTLRLVIPHESYDRISDFSGAGVPDTVFQNASSNRSVPKIGEVHSEDKLFGGLLTPAFEEGSCLSRYQSSRYRKASSRKPSLYLLSRLRNYEQLHRRCGPHTDSYNRFVKILRSGESVNSMESECKYIVWISFSGLGNRILTVASAFLYALLTDRILLVDQGKDMPDLFCEPFPETSWFLPSDFPLKQKFESYDQNSPSSYGNMLKKNILNNSTKSIPSSLYLHIAHDYDVQDKLFFCDEDQQFLSKIPWLVMKTNIYFVPSLFLMPSFEQELIRLFPDKATVFHHLGRYLFHPTNQVWGLVMRYYQAYLTKADQRIGIQIRVFETEEGPFQYVMDQILACALKEKVLPDVDREDSLNLPLGNRLLKSVLITSLSPWYYEQLRDLYWEHSTVTGDLISVFQPSHEGYQQTEKTSHNRKAWAEMYLLSLTDVLITSAWSTFGYVAQGLGGLKPWILYKPENHTAPNPPCRRVMSMEPCFHAPPFYDCKAKKGVDTGEIVPHVKHCEDMSWGLKLVEPHDVL